jgi:hypothetical protein
MSRDKWISLRSSVVRCDEPITNLGDRLDAKDATGLLLGDCSKARYDAIDCVLSDDPAFPDELAEIVLADDAALGAVKRDQQLHDARFEDGDRSGVHDFACRRAYLDVSDCERLLVRQDDGREVHRVCPPN